MSDWSHELESHSVADTLGLGRAIGSVLDRGDVVGLVGQLGAGKTHLVKGIALGLGLADSRDVSSPTFVLVKAYDTRIPLFHLDAYRLYDSDELLSLGFDEMCGGDAVVVVEWADRVPDAIGGDAVKITLNIKGPEDRQIRLQAPSALGRRLLSGLDPAAQTRDNDSPH